jgi:hypothetical protein
MEVAMRMRGVSSLVLAGGLVVATLPTLALTSAAAASSGPAVVASVAADQFSLARRLVRRSPASAPVVTSVRAAHHRGFDRVTVSLRGASPGFDVRFVSRLVRDPSGNPIDLLGPASLEFALLPANGHNPNTGASTITTALRKKWRLDQLRETAVIGDFEAVFTLGVGLSRRAPFRVLTLLHPTRIVVDIRHQ